MEIDLRSLEGIVGSVVVKLIQVVVMEADVLVGAGCVVNVVKVSVNVVSDVMVEDGALPRTKLSGVVHAAAVMMELMDVVCYAGVVVKTLEYDFHPQMMLKLASWAVHWVLSKV